MALRFRKSVGLLGGLLRLNLSRSGPSLSFRLGPLSWNTRRRRLRANLPGPLYWEQDAPEHGRHRSTGQSAAGQRVVPALWVGLTVLGCLVLAFLLF